jgi:hypothetical protein
MATAAVIAVLWWVIFLQKLRLTRSAPMLETESPLDVELVAG